jgi:hypothetical protein
MLTMCFSVAVAGSSLTFSARRRKPWLNTGSASSKLRMSVMQAARGD